MIKIYKNIFEQFHPHNIILFSHHTKWLSFFHQHTYHEQVFKAIIYVLIEMINYQRF